MYIAKIFASSTMICVGLLLLTISAAAQDDMSTNDPGHKANATVAGIKYSVPKGYALEKGTNPRITLLRGKDNLAVFVSVAEPKPDNKTLNDLAAAVAAQYVPAETAFKWKPTGVEPEPAGKFETAGGGAKGLSKGKRYVEFYYKVLHLRNRYITLGYITDPGEQTAVQADFSFNSDTAELASVDAWYAVVHIMASITGERFQDIEEKLPASLADPKAVQ